MVPRAQAGRIGQGMGRRTGCREGTRPLRAERRAALAALGAAAAALLVPGPAGRARADEAAPQGRARGPVTNLPLPRFVSLKAPEANARRGPSLSHRIDWVFRHRGLPLEVVAEYGHWRKVRDWEGQGGWIHYALLSGVRTVLVTAERVPLRGAPAEGGRPLAWAEAGVIARLGSCRPRWCRITAGGVSGWVRKSEIWGVYPDEIRD